jgi:hypothetical protein
LLLTPPAASATAAGLAEGGCKPGAANANASNAASTIWTGHSHCFPTAAAAGTHGRFIFFFLVVLFGWNGIVSLNQGEKQH